MGGVSVTALPTADSIHAQIAALDNTLVDLDCEATSLSFRAVSGDKQSAKTLGEINAKIFQGNADRVVLLRALATAEEIEAQARRDEFEAGKAGHLADAKVAAARLLELAARADTMVRDYAALQHDLKEAEREVRNSLRLAGEPVENARAGRSDIVGKMIAAMENCMGAGDFANKRSVSDVVRMAWSELLEGNQDD